MHFVIRVYLHLFLMSKPDTSPLSAWRGCTCFELRKLTRVVTRLYDQHLALAGLKTTQYSLLMHVKHEALPVTRLAALLGVERTTLSRNLKPLLEAGWVTLQPGADPRQRIVTISAAGGDKLRAARAAWRKAQAALEQALGTEAVRALHGQIDLSMERLAPLVDAGLR